MIRFQFYLQILVKAFQFIRKFRLWREAVEERRAKERALEREHQRLLVEGITRSLVEFAQANNSGLLEMAKASAAQAEVMSTWLKGFQVSDTSPTPSQTVRDEDEWVDEQRRKIALNDPTAFPVDLPPELQLAYSLGALEQFPDESFDREGRDFPSP